METKTKALIAGAMILSSCISGCATYDGQTRRHYEGQRHENHGWISWGAVPFRDSSVENYRHDSRYNPTPSRMYEPRNREHPRR